MKKLIIFLSILISLVSIFVLISCDGEKEQETDQTTKEQETETNESEKSIILATSEWPPFEFTENKVKKGTDVDIVREVFKEMGLWEKTEIKFYPWDRCVENAKEKKVDALFTLRKNDERLKYLNYPDEVLSYSENVFFYKKGNEYSFETLEDLKGLTIGISNYSYGDEFMNSDEKYGYTFDKITGENADELNFRKLINDRVDLFACDKAVGLYLAKQKGFLEQIDFLDKSITKFEMYLAFTKKDENKELMEKYDNALKKIKEDGRYDKIRSKYLGD